MRLLLLFCLTLAIGLSAAELDLGSLQWTNANYFWTWDGPSQPLIDRNLSGGKITLGGKNFDKGICGHTGFSIVYNVNKQAESFEAVIGVEETDAPGDKKHLNEESGIILIIKVDRQELINHTITIGSEPVKVNVDLRDKTQLEIMASYHKHFFRQRIGIGNPVIRSSTPEKLQETLKSEYCKYENALHYSPEYPAAPEWEAITVTKTSFNDYDNAYNINNGKISMTILPEAGGRIVSFRENSSQDDFIYARVPTSKNRLLPRGRASDANGSGHFMRIQPGTFFYPADPILKYGSYDIEFPSDGRIIMTSQTSPVFLLKYQYEIQVAPEKNSVRIISRILNAAPFVYEVGIWSITRIRQEKIRQIRLPTEQENPQNPCVIDRFKVLKSADSILLSDINLNPESGEFKCYAIRSEVNAELIDGRRFAIQYLLPEYDSTFYPVHLFSGKLFFEIESHGKVEQCKPEACVELAEIWFIN